jgi:hypothetical protein
MINFSNVAFESIIVHKVGNKSREENIVYSQNPITIDNETVRELLTKYFLSPFKKSEFYRFHHDADLNYNEMFSYSQKTFENPSTFFEQSVNIAKHLYEQSNHVKIKGGEFYLVYLKDCMIDDEVMDAIGLFKTEDKETYLRISRKDKNFEIDYDDGININKLDKGCLIFNTEKESGYIVTIVDSNKSNEALYWKDDFLNIMPREDNYYHTKTFMNLCKNFIDEVLPENEEIDKTEQIEMKNKTVKYFAEKENFDNEEFEKEVMSKPAVIEAFREYKKTYEDDYDIEVENEFEISQHAAKSAKKQFKSIVKLDKNFHIYIHGNRDLIEKGFDEEKKLKFYQLFFNEET